MKQFFTLIVCIFVISTRLFSQENPNEADKLYTPPADSPFGSSSAKKTSSSSIGNYFPIKNAILFEPFWLFRGVTGAAYSRQILSSGLVASVGLGAQRKADIVMNEFLDVGLDDFGSDENEPISSSELFNASEFVSGKMMTQFSLTYYFDYDEMEGAGIEFGFRRQAFNMRLDGENFSSNYGDSKVIGDESYTLQANTFFLNWKNQWKGKGKTPFVHSLSYGIGLKTLKHETYSYSIVDGNNGSETQIRREQETTTSSPFLTAMFSYSLGFGF